MDQGSWGSKCFIVICRMPCSLVYMVVYLLRACLKKKKKKKKKTFDLIYTQNINQATELDMCLHMIFIHAMWI